MVNVNISGIGDLAEQVKKNDGFLSLEMKDVRNAYGAQKLGTDVREGIEKALQAQNLSYHPREIPRYQDQWIILYLPESPAEVIINAVLRPGSASGEVIHAALSGTHKAALREIKGVLEGLNLDDEVSQ